VRVTLGGRDSSLARAPALAFGAANVASAAVVALGVFRGLPERYLPVDLPAAIVVVLLGASGAGLAFRTRWGVAVGKVAAGVTLALGLVLVAALAMSASYLAGVYGPVGEGGAVLFTLVLALAVPYLVALPALELFWLRRGEPKAPPPSGADAARAWPSRARP
jgi:hypothetical protein